MIDLSLHSHSHSNIEVIFEEGHSYVKKTFNENIERAKKCIDKQEAFSTLNSGALKISAVPVNSFDIKNNLAILRMPFIEGLSGASFAIHGGKIIAKHLSLALSCLLYHEMSESSINSIDTILFINKLASVKENTKSKELVTLIEKVEALVSDYPASMPFPIGPCHGDLTLNNMILNPVDGVVLIDFLDTFLESPLQDIAKINQDFIYGWSFRKESPSLQVKSTLFYKAAYPNAAKHIYGFYSNQVDLLTIIALVRIAPYVIDDITMNWLKKSVLNCVNRMAA